MKLRFAPSPTGYLHVGGARTAIFNLLHARRYGGRMLLRIEDTDVERSRQHHAEQIVSSLQWLGIEWDEGPLYQSDRLTLYRERAEELVKNGSAYRCYCTIEELEEERVAAEKAGVAYRYSGRCRTLTVAPAGAPNVIRFKVQPGPIDFRAFGVEPPTFAHLPLILGPDRKRLSKRTGATSAEEYRDMGILPEALFNFLTLLGWSPGGDREIFSKTEAASLFDLSQVHKAPAIFDAEKLLWMNGQYLMQLTPEEIYPHLLPFLRAPAPAYEVLALIELH